MIANDGSLYGIFYDSRSSCERDINMFRTKIVSSLEKAFLEESIDKHERLERISALRGERVSFQLLYTYELDGEEIFQRLCALKLEGALSKYATVRLVREVPVTKPVPWGYFDEGCDGGYLRTTPGLYPDLLEPLSYRGKFRIMRGALCALWIDIEIPEDMPELVGEQVLTLISTIDVPDKYGHVIVDTKVIGIDRITVDVIDAILPKQTLKFTQWFHCDCLADYYKVPIWSERHWEIIESFARTAVKNGINMLLTPVFTPPLDTAVGGERPTTQLVAIKKTDKGYRFNWRLFDRWVEMCDRVGIEYFEISHLFTQWGAEHAPKIVADVEGEERKIFGWETDAHGEEYTAFLRSFIKAFIRHAKSLGIDRRCFFHISDEPSERHLDSYKKAKSTVSRLLSDYVIMDALSEYEFYKSGLVKTPIPSTDHIKPFIQAKVKDLWTYYCCGQFDKVSNRFLSMPSARNRSIGMQMYKYNIVGFLHWGYNFYYNCSSVDLVNPYMEASGEKWVSAGDAHSVYPAPDGTAYESISLLVFADALTDMRAMQRCEEYYSHEAVVAAIEEVLGEELTFERCALRSEEMLAVREKINSMIKAAVSKQA